MVSLLYDEHPMIVSPTLATILGSLNEAVFLQQLHYWLELKRKTGKNFFDGRYWVFNSHEEWVNQFPWLSVSTLRRTIDNLCKKGFVIKGNYNQKKMDHTIWYTLNYEKIMEITKKTKEQKDKESRLALEMVQKEEKCENPESLEPQATDRCVQNEQIDLSKSTNRCVQNEQIDLSKLTNRCVQNEQIDLLKMSRSNCSKRADRCVQNEQANTIDYPLNYPKTTSSETSGEDSRLPVDAAEVLLAYNRICKSFPQAIGLTPKRRELIFAIFADGITFAQIQEAFQRAEDSDFLTGRAKGADWNRFDFDWLIQLSSVVNLLEGKYDNVSPQKKMRIEKYQSSFVRVTGDDEIDKSVTQENIDEYPSYLRDALKRHCTFPDNQSSQEVSPL